MRSSQSLIFGNYIGTIPLLRDGGSFMWLI